MTAKTASVLMALAIVGAIFLVFNRGDGADVTVGTLERADIQKSKDDAASGVELAVPKHTPSRSDGIQSQDGGVDLKEGGDYSSSVTVTTEVIEDTESEYITVRDELVRLKAAGVNVLVKERRFFGASDDGDHGSTIIPEVVSDDELFLVRTDSTGSQLLLLTRSEFPDLFHAKDRLEELWAKLELSKGSSNNVFVFTPK